MFEICSLREIAFLSSSSFQSVSLSSFYCLADFILRRQIHVWRQKFRDASQTNWDTKFTYVFPNNLTKFEGICLGEAAEITRVQSCCNKCVILLLYVQNVRPWIYITYCGQRVLSGLLINLFPKNRHKGCTPNVIESKLKTQFTQYVILHILILFSHVFI